MVRACLLESYSQQQYQLHHFQHETSNNTIITDSELIITAETNPNALENVCVSTFQ